MASTQPNNIALFGCTVSNNSLNGITVTGGSSFNMFGGDVENNGTAAIAPEGWGLKFIDAGYEGGTGFNLYSVYFESNAWGGDVVVTNTTAEISNAVTFNYFGCSFVRATSNHYPQSNIIINTADRNVRGLLKTHISGCTFKSAGSYSPSASRPYIQFQGTETASPETLFQRGNLFEDPVETPSFLLYENRFCTASRAQNLSVPSNTETQIPLDTVISFFGMAPVGNQLTVQVKGVYSLSMCAVFDTNGGSDTTGYKVAIIKRNGEQLASGFSVGLASVTSTITTELNVGDIITFHVLHRYTTAINLVGSNAANTAVTICQVS